MSYTTIRGTFLRSESHHSVWALDNGQEASLPTVNIVAGTRSEREAARKALQPGEQRDFVILPGEPRVGNDGVSRITVATEDVHKAYLARRAKRGE